MALNKAEKKTFDELKKRAETAEATNETLAAEKEEILSAADKQNVDSAQIEIDKNNAVAEALAAQQAVFDKQLEGAKVGKVDKSVSPEKATKFDPSVYAANCFGGDARYVQNGWFYDHNREPLRPVNKAD